MSDDRASVLREARGVAADLHHGLKVGEVVERTEALAHLYERARDCDATSEELAEIRTGFTEIARELREQGQHKRRSRWRRRQAADDVEQLQAPAPRRELSPGPRA